jgi:hypothetical protein
MTQLIINGTEYPETSKDRYTAHKEESSVLLRMASGRLVEEVGYKYWIIEYSYDYFTESLKQTCMADLDSGSVSVSFLTPQSDELQTGTFKCTKKPTPAFKFSRSGEAYWHDISFRLEGVAAIA